MPNAKTFAELQAAGYKFDSHGRCKGATCHAEIEWWITPRGRKIPYDLMTSSDSPAIAHFTTCPDVRGLPPMTPTETVTAPAAIRRQGFVFRYSNQKGFGFLRREAGGDDFFFHFHELKGAKIGDIEPGQHYEFTPLPPAQEFDDKGKRLSHRAVNLQRLA